MIISFARWHIPSIVVNEQPTTSTKAPIVDKLGASTSNTPKGRPLALEGTNIPLYTAFLENLRAMRSTHWDKERDYSQYIYHLAFDMPKQQASNI